MKDIDNRIPCSVSQELVDLVAHYNPDKYMKNGKVLISTLLFDIGFKIDHSMKSQGIYKNFDVFIRDNTRPSKLYKTSCVYNGEVRNTVQSIDNDGRITYTNQKHPLYTLYETYEVLQPKALNDFVEESKFEDITDIGDPTVYSNAFANQSKFKQVSPQTAKEIEEVCKLFSDSTITED